ncbi:MAG: SPASM domain-containing protein [Lachnospiraceae bacterium]|nr:SPASM domain-containing protein [Lachnospiraceae bacterium]
MKKYFVKGKGDNAFKCVCALKQAAQISQDDILIYVTQDAVMPMESLDVCSYDGQAVDAVIYIMDDNNQPEIINIDCPSYMHYYGQFFSLDDDSLTNKIEKYLLDNRLYRQLKMLNKLKIDIAVATKNATANYMPRYLHISHTNFCNAQCIMCTHYFLGNKHARHLDERMLDKFNEFLPYAEILTLHGTGEPFMDKNILKTLALAEKYGVQIVTNTNLSYLSDELFGYVSRIFKQLNVSCDGATKDIFESIRKNINFESFEKNLSKLASLSNKIRLCMASVAMRQNILTLPDLVRFAKKYGFKSIAFNCLKAYKEIGNFDDELINYPHTASRSFHECLKLGKELGIEVLVPEDFLLDKEDSGKINEEYKRMLEVEKRTTPNRQKELSVKNSEMELTEIPSVYEKDSILYNCDGICDWLAEKPYVDLDGNVALCCFNKKVIVGNVFTSSIRDIINAPTYKAWRKSFYENDMPKDCGHCQFVQNGTLERLKVYERK